MENPGAAEVGLARVNVNFVGLWRIVLGLRSITIEADTVDEARDYVEMNYGSLYWKWLRFRGRHDNRSVWATSHVLLNGRGLEGSENARLKEGDQLDLVPRVAGG